MGLGYLSFGCGFFLGWFSLTAINNGIKVGGAQSLQVLLHGPSFELFNWDDRNRSWKAFQIRKACQNSVFQQMLAGLREHE